MKSADSAYPLLQGRKLFREQFRLLQELMHVQAAVEGHGSPARAVYACFLRQAEGLSPRHARHLAHLVDLSFSGLATKVSADARLTTEELLLYCYCVMDLDADIIADLLGLDNCNCVYTRKYRLKRKIRLRCGSRRDYYLSFLG